mgnify:CR=1 FL=1
MRAKEPQTWGWPCICNHYSHDHANEGTQGCRVPDCPCRQYQPAGSQERRANYAGLWIGIIGTSIVASGQTMAEVHDQLTQAHIDDALIVFVDHDESKWDFLIGSQQRRRLMP